jgi:hypothetical protein
MNPENAIQDDGPKGIRMTTGQNVLDEARTLISHNSRDIVKATTLLGEKEVQGNLQIREQLIDLLFQICTSSEVLRTVRRPSLREAINLISSFPFLGRNNVEGLKNAAEISELHTSAISQALTQHDRRLATNILFYLSQLKLLLANIDNDYYRVRAASILRKPFCSRPDYSIVLCSKVLEGKPSSSHAVVCKAASMCDLGLFDEALSFIQMAEVDSKNPFVIAVWTRALRGTRNYECAYTVLMEAHESDPSNRAIKLSLLAAARHVLNSEEYEGLRAALGTVELLLDPEPEPDTWIFFLSIEELIKMSEIERARMLLQAFPYPEPGPLRSRYRVLEHKIKKLRNATTTGP